MLLEPLIQHLRGIFHKSEVHTQVRSSSGGGESGDHGEFVGQCGGELWEVAGGGVGGAGGL